MRKKLLIAGAVLFVIIAGTYLFVRFKYLRSPDFKPDASKEKNAIDLRPSIIAKFRQLVKDGSDGLYVLSIDSLEPHLLSSKLDITGGSIRVDSAAMKRLDSLHLLPDNIFTVRFSAMHVDGMGISDLLNTHQIDRKNISIVNPVIHVYNNKRLYNESDRKRNDSLSLYEKLKGQLKKVAIGNIDIRNGSFINHDAKKNSVTKFNDVTVLINDILIDSTTQHDKNRFLFAKRATISTKNYSMPTADGLYFFNAGNVSISAEQHMITAHNIELKPRFTRQQFESRLHYNKDLYHMVIPKVVLKNVNWQSLVTNDKIVAEGAEIAGGNYSIYFDRSIPQGPLELNNFPHQILIRLPVPLSIKQCNIHDMNFTYEEHNPLTDKSGIVYFDKVTAQINNISNIPAEVKRNPFCTFSGNTSFMHHVPLAVKFRFDLSKYRTGEFSADVRMDALDNTTINPIAEPLGLFSVKKGRMQKAVVHIDGNNFKTTGTITMYYNDLHITPLKKDDQGDLKKKRVTGLLANIILIKNENPKGGELRQPVFMLERDNRKNFFSLLWKSILTGIVKTIGIPVKFAVK